MCIKKKKILFLEQNMGSALSLSLMRSVHDMCYEDTPTFMMIRSMPLLSICLKDFICISLGYFF